MGEPMGFLVGLVRRTTEIGAVLGGVFLVAMMALIVSNIIFRVFGSVIPGSFEISELFIVVTASFALGYAALHQSHVDVEIIVSKLPARWRAIINVITSFLSMATWAISAYASTLIMVERWLTEVTEMLSIPYLPFRLVLLFGLILISLIYLINMLAALRKVMVG